MTDLKGEPYPENMFFMDDVFVITKMLKDEWSLGPQDTPVISFEMEGQLVDARKAYVYVYHVSRYNSMSSTDYNTLQRTSFIDIRVSTRARPKLYMYTQEIYRIIYANRRLGPHKLNGYTWIEITNDRPDNSAQGWYSVLLSLKMMSYCYPIFSPGFGDEINSLYAELLPDDDDYEEEQYDFND